MVADQKYSSDISSEQEVIRRTEKLAHLKDLLEAGLDDLDEYIDKETVIDLIHEIAPSPNIKKCKDFSYSSESSEESDLVELIEGLHRVQASINTSANVNCISQKHISKLGIAYYDENNCIKTPDASYSTLGKVDLHIGFNDSKKYKSIPSEFIIVRPDWLGPDLILEGPWF
ncbi:hypothetical protein RhiirA1_462717 [Rhizophagus irregularis]|uniref:Uncharacterized protein n=1 Tax=Rhizophagus irregularis TaxID=588596 RepID=A0A2N0RLS9_9GLOM|nr:hypothetical protein RhiirA1_462717 [Rhizophagus irregularis]